MNKIKGTIDRFEEDKAVIRYNGSEIIVPKDIISMGEGDTVIVTISSEEEDGKTSQEVAKALLSDILRGE